MKIFLKGLINKKIIFKYILMLFIIMLMLLSLNTYKNYLHENVKKEYNNDTYKSASFQSEKLYTKEDFVNIKNFSYDENDKIYSVTFKSINDLENFEKEYKESFLTYQRWTSVNESNNILLIKITNIVIIIFYIIVFVLIIFFNLYYFLNILGSIKLYYILGFNYNKLVFTVSLLNTFMELLLLIISNIIFYIINCYKNIYYVINYSLILIILISNLISLLLFLFDIYKIKRKIIF